MLRLRLPSLVVFLVLFGSPAFAQGVDLRTTVTAPARMERGATFTVTATVENLGPNVAHDIHWETEVNYSHCNTTTIGVLEVGEKRSLDCTLTFDPLYYVNIASSSARAAEFELDYSNNRAEAYIAMISGPDLVLGAYANVQYADPGLPYALNIYLMNAAVAEAKDVVLTLDIPGILGYEDVPSNCSVSGSRMTCAVGDVAPRELQGAGPSLLFVARPIAHDVPAHLIEGTLEAHASNGEETPESNHLAHRIQTFQSSFVTNGNDSGPGSLRAAIEEANAPAKEGFLRKLAFRIPGDGPWQTIRPTAPLPPITSPQLFIDGATQTRYYGDTNPLGPEIQIDGTEAGAGTNGLTIQACWIDAWELSVTGFDGAGIWYQRPQNCTMALQLHHNYVGVDPTGAVARGNGRGIFLYSTTWMHENVISGNRNSGVFALYDAQIIERNLIGLSAKGDLDLGNGASGIYIGAEASGTIEHNTIAFNHHFGIGVDNKTRQLRMFENSIHSNWQTAIDWGLDGAGAPDNVPPAPEIYSATWDAARQVTVVRGFAPGKQDVAWVTIYANHAPDPSGRGEAQFPLVFRQVQGDFTLELPNDLRGRWVSASTTYINGSWWENTIALITGEVGTTVQVPAQ